MRLQHEGVILMAVTELLCFAGRAVGLCVAWRAFALSPAARGSVETEPCPSTWTVCYFKGLVVLMTGVMSKGSGLSACLLQPTQQACCTVKTTPCMSAQTLVQCSPGGL